MILVQLKIINLNKIPVSIEMKWWNSLWVLPCLFMLLLSPIFLGSCRAIKEPEFVAVDKIRVDRLGSTSTILSMKVRYHNPNKFRVKVKEAHGEAWLDGKFLGTFKTDTLIIIPPNGPFVLPVTVEVDLKKIFQNTLSVLLSKYVTLKLAGRARIGKGFVFINYPIQYEGKQDLEKLWR